MTATPIAVTLAHQVRPNDDVLMQEVGGEAVLLHLASEQYFSLDAVGTRIWSLLGTHDNLSSVAHQLCAEYTVDPQRIRSDLLALVGQLSAAGLVKVG